jgi:hypothetical protein
MAFKVMNRGGTNSYQSEDFEFAKEGDSITGYLVEVATLIGKKGKMAGKPFKKYTFKTENGYESFLGGSVLDNPKTGLPTIALGTSVRVTYQGYPEGKNYKDYLIEADESDTIPVTAQPATTATTAADIVNNARVN